MSRPSRREFLSHAAGASIVGLASTLLAQRVTAREGREAAIGAVRRMIPGLLELHGVPGLSLAVIEHSRVLWAEGFGVTALRDGHHVSTTTIFGAASLSKPLFAYVVLKLAEDGAIDLDAPLSSYDESRGAPTLPATATARTVLSHIVTTAQPSDSSFEYSPSAYIRLQAIIEHRLGTTAAVLLNRRLFAPLDMDRTRLGAPWGPAVDVATGHVKEGPQRRTMGLGVASGVYTTAVDYARFLLAIIRASSRWDPFRLSAGSVNNMVTPCVVAGPGVRWALGWAVVPTSDGDAVWHWGDGGGFRNLALFYPRDGKGVVILTNGHNGPAAYRRIAKETIAAPAAVFDWIDAHS
jgi:CubicO group peptidase (beta-lactamase class C family)